MVKIRFGSPKTGDYANLNKFPHPDGMNPASSVHSQRRHFRPRWRSLPIGALARKAQDRRAA